MLNKWRKLKAIVKSLDNGCTLTAACDAAHIHRITLWSWRRKDPKVADLIERALESQIQVVEDALFKRAAGYRYEEVTKERAQGSQDKQVIRVVTKEVVPDTTAIMFYLMNRVSHRWVDKRAVVNNTNINKVTVNPLKDVKDEELDAIASGITNRLIQVKQAG